MHGPASRSHWPVAVRKERPPEIRFSCLEAMLDVACCRRFPERAHKLSILEDLFKPMTEEPRWLCVVRSGRGSVRTEIGDCTLVKNSHK